MIRETSWKSLGEVWACQKSISITPVLENCQKQMPRCAYFSARQPIVLLLLLSDNDSPPPPPTTFILNVITPANTASNWPLTLTGTVYEKNGTHISLITEQRDKNSPETAFCRLIGSDAISWKPSSGTAFLCCWKITLTQVAEPIPNDFRSITVMIILGEITSKIEPISISMKRLFIVFKMSRVCTTFCS